MAAKEPTFRGIPIAEIALVPARAIPLPMAAKITPIFFPAGYQYLGKQWASIESHQIQLNLFGEEETKDWLMGHGKTFYDWLRESLGTRV